MSVIAGAFNGNEWEQHVKELLVLRYGPDFVEVPDTHGGDFGLEGFTLSGHAYQCYACEEPLETAARAEKQKAKITRDISKFINNQNDLTKLLGDTKITHWMLVVPIQKSSKVLQHAEAQAARVRQANLPYVGDCFHINVVTADYFVGERHQLARPKQLKMLSAKQVADADIEALERDKRALVTRLDRKARSLSTLTNPEKKRMFRRRMLIHYLDGQNFLAELRSKYAFVYEAVMHCKNERERFLATASMLTTCPATETLAKTLADYKQELLENAAGLDPQAAELLAYGAIADWLLRCPLEFGETEDE